MRYLEDYKIEYQPEHLITMDHLPLVGLLVAGSV
jgi:hypothetical protein